MRIPRAHGGIGGTVGKRQPGIRLRFIYGCDGCLQVGPRPQSNLSKFLEVLPALKKPTISHLSDENWLALNTILDESTVRDIIPRLKQAGAQGIVEYPLNKIVL